MRYVCKVLGPGMAALCNAIISVKEEDSGHSFLTVSQHGEDKPRLVAVKDFYGHVFQLYYRPQHVLRWHGFNCYRPDWKG